MVIGEKKAKEWYQKTEKEAIQAYESVSNRFLSRFFVKEGESIEDAKKRLEEKGMREEYSRDKK